MANGNLQRIIRYSIFVILLKKKNLEILLSSYYNSEVQVSILKFDKIQNESISTSTYHREVSITCLNQVFYFNFLSFQIKF